MFPHLFLRISSAKLSAIPPVRLGLFQKKFRKDPGNALRAFPGIPLESTAGIPQAYNSRHLKAPEHFQNSLPPTTAGDASFSEVVLERAS